MLLCLANAFVIGCARVFTSSTKFHPRLLHFALKRSVALSGGEELASGLFTISPFG